MLLHLPEKNETISATQGALPRELTSLPKNTKQNLPAAAELRTPPAAGLSPYSLADRLLQPGHQRHQSQRSGANPQCYLPIAGVRVTTPLRCMLFSVLLSQSSPCTHR